MLRHTVDEVEQWRRQFGETDVVSLATEVMGPGRVRVQTGLKPDVRLLYGALLLIRDPHDMDALAHALAHVALGHRCGGNLECGMADAGAAVLLGRPVRKGIVCLFDRPTWQGASSDELLLRKQAI